MSQRLSRPSLALAVSLLSALCVVLCCVLALSPRAALASPTEGYLSPDASRNTRDAVPPRTRDAVAIATFGALANLKCPDYGWEPNESFGAATLLSINTVYQAYICGKDDLDFFAFDVPDNYHINTYLAMLPIDVDLYLFNSDGVQIGSSTNGGTDPEVIDYDAIKGGRYVILAQGKNGVFDEVNPYTFALDAWYVAPATETPTPTQIPKDTPTPTPTVTETCPDAYEPNNTFASAWALSTNTNYSAYICYDGDLDYFQFFVNDNCHIHTYLTSLPIDVDLYLYDQSGNLVASSTNEGTYDELIDYDVDKGGPFVILAAAKQGLFDPVHLYKLRFDVSCAPSETNTPTPTATVIEPSPTRTATPTWTTQPSPTHTAVPSWTAVVPSPTPTATGTQTCPDPYEPNDTFDTPLPFDPAELFSYICHGKDEDYFVFTVQLHDTVEVWLTQLPKDYDLYLYDGGQNEQGSSLHSGTTDEYVIASDVKVAGEWRVRVKSKSGDYDPTTPYKLRLKITPGGTATPSATPVQPSPTPTLTTQACNTDPSEPNDSFATAHVISPGGWTQGLICPDGDKDFFRFTANEGQTIRLELRSLPADYNLFLWSPAAVQVGSSQNGGTADELITYPVLYTGDYRVEVRPAYGQWHATDSYDLRPDVFIATATPTNSPTATPTRTRTPTPTPTRTPTPTNTSLPAVDITLYGLEVTQGIQNLNSDMPLVANRVTRARGYARTTLHDLPNVHARLWASRDGVNLAHSPTEAMWSPNPVHMAGANRLNLRDAYFFYIWPEWQTGTVTFRFEVNYDHAVPETNYSNNAITRTLTFRPANGLNVVMIDSWVAGLTHGFGEETTWPVINSLFRQHPIASLGVWCATLTIVVEGPYDVLEDILDEVDSVDFWTPNPVAGVHWVGMINGNLPGSVNGQGYMGGTDLWVRMAPPSTWPAWVYNGGTTLSHEMGHNKGIGHTRCGTTDFPEPYPWPDPNCALGDGDPLGYYGLDVQHGRWGLPSPEVISNDRTAAAPHLGFPIMGYTWPRWVSPWEYCRLLRVYGVPCGLFASAQSTEEALQEAVAANPAAYADPAEAAALRSASVYLRASGVIVPSAGTAQFRQVIQLADPLADAVNEQVERMGYRQAFNLTGVDEAYTLVQVDGSGTVLASNEILLNVSCDGSSCDSQPFAELVPYASGATKVQVRQGTAVLAERSASANPPTVSLLAPNGGGTVGPGSIVQWSAFDADRDALTFNILYSRDNGATWQLVGLNLSGTSYPIPSALPGSTQGRMRVIAMDGFYTARDTSDGTFTVAGTAPLAAIFAPATGDSYASGDIVELSGAATDLEDGPLAGSQLTWTSSISGTLGSGEVLALDTLPPGRHQITLTATDGDGQTGTAVVEIDVGYGGGHSVYLPVVLKRR